MTFTKGKVLVGLSGGVDSSVAALILKEQGYEVIGATMAIWDNKKEIASKSQPEKHGACFGPDEKEDIEAAEKIAKQLNIPYYVFDCSKQYEKIVLENFRLEYQKGRTPNPCIWCNALIKFGVLPQIAKENGVVFDKFATGHYAKIEENNGKYYLKKAVYDKNSCIKDQTYFLYRLSQEQLKNILLPLGHFTKNEIRTIASKNNLHTAQKPDSQDFYTGDYNELLNLEEKEGNIVDIDGKILGTHKGIWNYTIGQRKGLRISSDRPLYVLELKSKTNEVVVGNIDKTFTKSLTATNLSWITDKPPCKFSAEAKIRSTAKPVFVNVKLNNNIAEVEFEEFQKSVAKGQSIVFYQNDTVLGGGIINET